MLEVLFGIVAMICIGAFILGAIAFVFGKIATFYDDNKDEIKTMAKNHLTIQIKIRAKLEIMRLLSFALR